jgi:predicted MFS family arabinose efflux permease
MSEQPKEVALVKQVAAITAIRLVVSAGHRMAYPFLPAIARGLGVSIPAASLMMTARSAVGLASPLFGPLSDRVGRRRTMAGALLSMVGGATLVALVPRYPVAFVGFLLMGLAKVIFDPSLQAYLGDRVPYRRRGLYIAFTELSWAGAILLGAPIIGQVIERWGWRAPFVALAGLTAAGLGVLLLVLPAEGRRRAAAPFLAAFGGAFRQVLRRREAVALLLVTCLMMVANEFLLIVYGTWMESSFGLSVGGLGLATMVIGAAEMLGEISVGGLTDRLGKRRAVAIGLALTAACYVALPLVAVDLRSALVGLFVLFLGFEFAIVSIIPLATEAVPEARGTMMALNVAAVSLGRAFAAPLGVALWSGGGLIWNGLAASAATLVALTVLLALVRE